MDESEKCHGDDPFSYVDDGPQIDLDLESQVPDPLPTSVDDGEKGLKKEASPGSSVKRGVSGEIVLDSYDSQRMKGMVGEDEVTSPPPRRTRHYRRRLHIDPEPQRKRKREDGEMSQLQLTDEEIEEKYGFMAFLKIAFPAVAELYNTPKPSNS